MKFHYNSPVILTLTLSAFVVRLLGDLSHNSIIWSFFVLNGNESFFYPTSYLHLFTYILGHSDWNHFFGNFSVILLIGPLLEEKHGSRMMAFMIATTAIVTGVLHLLFFPGGILGASGIVFMLILLGSFSNFRQGHIPLTFVLICILYLGREIVNSFSYDNISQFAHIVGGLVGSIFGFRGAQELNKPTTPSAI